MLKLFTVCRRRFLSLHLSWHILCAFFIGLISGLCYRFFPEMSIKCYNNAASFKVFGVLFVNLIKMIVLPLIFSSIVSSIVSVGDVKKTGSLAIRAVASFVVMTVLSVILGIVVSVVFQPGKNVSFDKHAIMDQQAISSEIKHSQPKSVGDLLIDIVPSNLFEAFAKGDFLQIIFFATVLSLAIVRSGVKARPLVDLVNSLTEVMFTTSSMIMAFAPFAIFGLTSWLVGTQDLELIRSLGFVVFLVYGSCLFSIYCLYALFSIVVLRLNPIHFFRTMLPSQLLGYLLASISAMLPLSLSIAEKKLGISEEKAKFMIPFGATVNMNGGAINLAISSVFIAQLFGLNFTPTTYVTLVVLCVLGAIGTAPVPGASILALSGILAALNMPIEAIVIVLAVDRILDMMRTFTNITGDVFAALVVDRLAGSLDEKIYNAKN